MIRAASVSDIPALRRIEDDSFAGDRLTRRNFHHLLTKGKVSCLVHEEGDRIGGYALLLFRARAPIARLYSFAVSPHHRGNGIGRALLDACEREARARGLLRLRLEVRPDNAAALRMYRAAGFHEIETVADYYEDHADALRMEKALGAVNPGKDGAPMTRARRAGPPIKAQLTSRQRSTGRDASEARKPRLASP